MKPAELIDKAANKVGSISELARVLRWHKGSIAAIKAGGKLPPYRAAQIADVLGTDVVAAYLSAHVELAQTEHEREFWVDQLNERRKKMKYT